MQMRTASKTQQCPGHVQAARPRARARQVPPGKPAEDRRFPVTGRSGTSKRGKTRMKVETQREDYWSPGRLEVRAGGAS